jgi:hypothetical protein
MIKILAVSILTITLGVAFAGNEVKSPKNNSSKEAETQTKNDVTYLKNGRVRFSSIGYVPKKIVGKHMDMMNAIFEETPMGIVRMFKAAIAVKKLLDEIESMKPIQTNDNKGESKYFSTKEEEVNFIKSRITGILEPIDKFLEEALAKSRDRSVVIVMFAKSLGENARQGFLLPSLDSEGTPSKYLADNILTIEELNSAISEFFIFFSDLNAGLNYNVRQAYKKILIKLQAEQENQKNNNKK